VVSPNKQANIHMHVCNEVTLVWSSLRLIPIIEELESPYIFGSY